MSVLVLGMWRPAWRRFALVVTACAWPALLPGAARAHDGSAGAAGWAAPGLRAPALDRPGITRAPDALWRLQASCPQRGRAAARCIGARLQRMLPKRGPLVAPPKCVTRYPRAPANPDDDMACAENMVHVYNAAFFGTDLDILGDKLYAGSVSEGFRIYSLADPAAPKQLGAYKAAEFFWQADVEAFKLGTHTFVDLNMTDGNTPDPRGGRAEFVDVTDPADPKLVATITGDSHSGDVVRERDWFLPSRYGNGGLGRPGLVEPSFFNYGDLQVYELGPLLKGQPPKLIDCDAPCHDVDALWASSPDRGSEPLAPASPRTIIHDISVYPDYQETGRDMVEYPRPQEDPEQTKPEVGHYIPDGAPGWTSVFHRPKHAKQGYVYSTGGALEGQARGLHVYACVGELSPSCEPNTGASASTKKNKKPKRRSRRGR